MSYLDPCHSLPGGPLPPPCPPSHQPEGPSPCQSQQQNEVSKPPVGSQSPCHGDHFASHRSRWLGWALYPQGCPIPRSGSLWLFTCLGIHAHGPSSCPPQGLLTAVPSAERCSLCLCTALFSPHSGPPPSASVPERGPPGQPLPQPLHGSDHGLAPCSVSPSQPSSAPGCCGSASPCCRGGTEGLVPDSGVWPGRWGCLVLGDVWTAAE